LNDPYETNNLLPPGNINGAQLQAFANLSARLTNWHSSPVPPTIAKWEKQSGALTVAVPEQLGVAYELARVPVVDSTNWMVLTNFVREVRTNAAEITLTDPTPSSNSFYRVTASGR